MEKCIYLYLHSIVVFHFHKFIQRANYDHILNVIRAEETESHAVGNFSLTLYSSSRSAKIHLQIQSNVLQVKKKSIYITIYIYFLWATGKP